MAFEVRFFKFSKRENSTALPDVTGGAVFQCTLKDNCSLNNPILILELHNSGGNYSPNLWPDYNYCWVAPWQKFFFVSDWTNEGPLWAAHCTIDALASHRSEILDSVQYVAYSSVSGGNWVADTRIPVMKNASVSVASTSLSDLFSNGGLYILSYIGRQTTGLVALGDASLQALLNAIAGSTDNFDQDTVNQVANYYGTSAPMYAEEAIYAMSQVMTQNDILGKAYGTAPSCLRSCIYTPLKVPGNPDTHIWLGNFDTNVTGIGVTGTPKTGDVYVNIPWQHSSGDWRRGVCEQVYLYLPLVGMVSLSSDALVEESQLHIEYSYTLTDATIAFRVLAGNQVIGTYGGSCAINYPLGVNQQASAGQVMQSVMAGVTQTVSAGITGNIGGVVAGIATTAYNALDTALTSHPSSVGGIGGGAGSGLERNAICYTVNHETVITPSAMAATMGVPTMQPIQLSSASGYCQCVNAHVSAIASLEELSAITAHLNSGFYIE